MNLQAIVPFYQDLIRRHGDDPRAMGYVGGMRSFEGRRRNLIGWVARELPARGTVLDAGCGLGLMSEPLAQSGRRVVGLDLTPEMLAHAKRRVSRGVNGDVYRMPFADASFDGVVSIDVIQQLPDGRGLVQEAARVTKPGGTVLISTLNRRSIVRLVFRLLAGERGIREFRVGEIRGFMTEAGLVDLRVMHLYFPTGLAMEPGRLGIPLLPLCSSFGVMGRKA